MILFIFVLVAIVVASCLTYTCAQDRKIRALRIENIDSMTGVEFEHLKKLMGTQGYSII